ncbi:MAG: pyruvate kinase alpha/beta domain-containing protein [Candidatus Thorarchaeota archaeon]
MRFDTVFLKEASPEHTEQVLSVVESFLKENKEIEHVIVATTTGETGLAAAKRFPDHEVVVVSHHTGFIMPNENELDEDSRNAIIEAGAKLLTTTHAFAGVSRSFRKELGTWTPTELMAVAFRTFGQGTKVCAEIAMMAADAGLVRVDKDVVTIGGTGFGADTAWLVTPTNTSTFPKLRMKACLCKPLIF